MGSFASGDVSHSLHHFFRSLEMRLSSVHARKTSQILRPEAIKFSPCIGLLATSAPNLLANLRSVQLGSPACELASELFHQRTNAYEDGGIVSSRRYGPVAITKSRSRASYWLNPRAMGTMVGLAHSTNFHQHPLVDSKIDEALNALGIETNYVNREWSGVSMVRYRKIVRLLAEDLQRDKNQHHQLSTLPVAAAFVWEKAKTKQCLLDYLLSIESASGDVLLLPEYNDLRVKDSPMQKEWISSQFAPDFITADRVRAESPVLLFLSPLPQTAPTVVQSVGEALEVVSASLAMERCFKSPIKLGRYAYGDGKARPDCVEVVVREILDSLIYDASSGRLCPELLPATAHPAMLAFYRAMEAGEISDLSTMPSNTTARSKKTVEKASPASKNDQKDSPAPAPVSADTAPEAKAGAVKQYWETTTAGRVWFDLCSELPGAGYLSSTSDGRQYELKPTMLNVCAAVRILLGADSTQSLATPPIYNEDNSEQPLPQEIWKLKDLESFWNAHASQLIAQSDNCPIRAIRTSESTLRFRAPFSDTETINRELGSIQFVGGRNAIDIELESAHQLATVKHRLCVNPEERLWGQESRATYATYAAKHHSVHNAAEEALESVRSTVCSAVLGDTMLTSLSKDIRDGGASVRGLSTEQLDIRIVRALIASRWGEERRQGSDNTNADGDNATLSVTDASLTMADAKRQAESSVLMSTQALELIGRCGDPVLAAQLVQWMLQEAPPQLTFDSIAAVLLRYPQALRSTKPFHAMIDAVFGTTAERGVVLHRIVDIGTDQCPSKNNFAFFDGSDALSLHSKVKVAAVYAKYRIKG